MKILLICSKAFYSKILNYKKQLEEMGHEIYLPNCFDAPETEFLYKQKGAEEHAKFKARMFKQSEETISKMDAVLVLNFDKNGQKNYIGGATFLEVYDAFRLNKKIYFLHSLPEGILHDELIGFSPVILNEDLSKIKH